MFGRSAVRGKREADSANSERPFNNEKCCLIETTFNVQKKFLKKCKIKSCKFLTMT